MESSLTVRQSVKRVKTTVKLRWNRTRMEPLLVAVGVVRGMMDIRVKLLFTKHVMSMVRNDVLTFFVSCLFTGLNNHNHSSVMDTLGGSSSQGRNNLLVYCFYCSRFYYEYHEHYLYYIFYMIRGDRIANVHANGYIYSYMTFIVMCTTIGFIDFMECIFLKNIFINNTIHRLPLLPNRHTTVRNIGAFGFNAAQVTCAVCIYNINNT
jgi:hypothetical protein